MIPSDQLAPLTPLQRYYHALVISGRKPFRRTKLVPQVSPSTILLDLRSDQMRNLVRSNQVSFPHPVPVFERLDRPDLQGKIVQLYFVMGWSVETIALRYGMTHQRVSQILRVWLRRALEAGFIAWHGIPQFDPRQLYELTILFDTRNFRSA